MDNKIYKEEDKRIFSGSFPIETTELKVVTSVEVGDVIGVSASNTFGKYDTSTYTTPYAIAYTAAGGSGTTTAILTGGVIKEFVKLQSKEAQLTVELRKVGIFIK